MNANLPRRAAMALFLHCSGSGPRQWQPITAALAGHVDCVAPTLIGYGEGESWRGGQPLTLDDEVDHLAEHLYANPDGVHLVGHSYGAAIALQAALRHPHQVRSLTLYEPVRFSMLFGSPATAGAARSGVTTRRCWPVTGSSHELEYCQFRQPSRPLGGGTISPCCAYKSA